MITILLSFASSIIGSLLTILLAPRIQHAFWSRERITELRLSTYDKVNGITAAIYMHRPSEFFGASTIEVKLSPMKELHASLMTAHDEVKNRFSEVALHAFEKLQVLVEDSGLPQDKRTSYSAAREAALRQLHAESLRLF